ncbi:uncharacterized protein RJT20DRAFT_44753 [Scheffersomyces xylosifermentans]|uniref:uncharacterized protein n=1 Tax=Scheffersomyces xylosifermentans TaxID=1304137 RepID=UPI00315D69B9
MVEIKQNRKTYNQTNFKRILTSKLNSTEEEEGADSGNSNHKVSKPKGRKKTLKNDNSDLLIYLIYVNYLSELVAEGGDPKNGGSGMEGEITVARVEKAHEMLMKKYRG